MIRKWVLAALACAAMGCAPRVMLTDDVGREWDGHLAVGQRMAFGAEVIEPEFGGYEVFPTTHVVSEDSSVVGVEEGPYGVELVGHKKGETRIRLSFPDSERAVDIVVE